MVTSIKKRDPVIQTQTETNVQTIGIGRRFSVDGAVQQAKYNELYLLGAELKRLQKSIDNLRVEFSANAADLSLYVAADAESFDSFKKHLELCISKSVDLETFKETVSLLKLDKKNRKNN